MSFQIVHNDITNMHTDAIVNAANSLLRAGGGVCGAIFRAAGSSGLEAECREKAPCPTGQAVITKGYGLAARYIIHAVGPVWQGGGQGEEEALAGAYRHALLLAAEHGCESVSFPLISSGIYGYPREQALRVAVRTIEAFLEDHEMAVYLVVFDRKAVRISESLFTEVRHYVDRYYEPERGRRRLESELLPQMPAMQEEECPPSALREEECPPPAMREEGCPLSAMQEEECLPSALREEKRPQPFCAAPMFYTKPEASRKKALRQAASGKAAAFASASASARKLEDLLSHMDESFSERLLRLIDEKGYTDVEVYKRANMDRKLFSKIRGNKEYHPKKATVLALSVALRLSEDETADLLQSAGYSFSGSSRQDIIVRYFLQQKEYDMFTINETLFCFEEPLLGA